MTFTPTTSSTIITAPAGGPGSGPLPGVDSSDSLLIEDVGGSGGFVTFGPTIRPDLPGALFISPTGSVTISGAQAVVAAKAGTAWVLSGAGGSAQFRFTRGSSSPPMPQSGGTFTGPVTHNSVLNINGGQNYNATNIAPIGTVQATAAILTGGTTITASGVSSVAFTLIGTSPNDNAVINALPIGVIATIVNAGTAAAQVFPPVGAAINSGTVNAPMSVPAGGLASILSTSTVASTGSIYT